MASGSFNTSSFGAVVLRRATLADAFAMGLIASNTYIDTPVDALLCPYRYQYREDYIRGYQQIVTMRMLDPRSLSYVACPASSPSIPVAYAQFLRLGDDEAAKAYRRSRATVWLTLQRYYYILKFRIRKMFWPNRCEDRKAIEKFSATGDGEDEKYWNHRPERANRWEARSVVVSKECQGQGIGTKLMSEVLERAKNDNVVIGVRASPEGERLYRKLGFELLGRFQTPVDSPDHGGVMMWTPRKEDESR